MMRNLTDEEAEIYDSWLQAEAVDTGEALFETNETVLRKENTIMGDSTIDKDLILTQPEAFTLAEILDMNLFQIIRNDPDIDNIDRLLNAASAYNKLRKRGKYSEGLNDD